MHKYSKSRGVTLWRVFLKRLRVLLNAFKRWETSYSASEITAMWFTFPLNVQEARSNTIALHTSLIKNVPEFHYWSLPCLTHSYDLNLKWKSVYRNTSKNQISDGLRYGVSHMNSWRSPDCLKWWCRNTGDRQIQTQTDRWTNYISWGSEESGLLPCEGGVLEGWPKEIRQVATYHSTSNKADVWA